MAMPRLAAVRTRRLAPTRALAFTAAAVLLLAAAGAGAAEGARVLRLRHFTGPDHTRIVLDLDRACSFEVRRVEAPDRIAVNLPGAVFAAVGERAVGDGLVERIRCNAGDGRAQVVIDLSGRREFRAFSLPPAGGKPDRIVIDVIRTGGTPPPVVEAPAASPPAVPGGLSGDGGAPAGDIAVLEQAVRRSASREAPGNEGVDTTSPAVTGAVQDAAASRVVPLVADAEGGGGESVPAPGAGRAAPAETAAAGNGVPAPVVPPAEAPAKEPAAPASAPAPADEEPFIVIVDAGHGGDDPGAVRGSLEEKDICLDIAREVARQLDNLPGYRAVLTRDRDKFVALGRRVEIARQQKGDVFVSVHCNTHPRPSVNGMEVYFLSLQGATDREARELADKENAAGLVGLPPGEDHTDLVVDILMDLKMSRVLQDSGRLAASLLTAADRSGVVAGRRVKQAGFQVLKNLAMPSALVEVAYLSNQEDYRLLGDAGGRRKLAAAIVAGIQDWRAGTAPARPRQQPVLAAAARSTGDRWDTVYRVRSGDSLWKLADRYGTTMNEIARRNNLSERQRELRIGQRLRLPGGGARP